MLGRPRPMATIIPFSFTDATGAVLSNAATLSGGTGGTPIVVLLHGLGGTATDWTSPGKWRVHFNTSAPLPPDTVIGTFGTPAAGLFGAPPTLDPLLPSLTTFPEALETAGFETVLYSQIDPRGTLTRPTLELAALMRALHALPGLAERRFVLLGHSRGGLLARQFLKDHKGDPSAVGRITKVITLHSPHQGSLWGNEVTAPGGPTTTMAALLDASLNALRPGTGPVVATFLAPFITFTTTPAYLQMRVGGPYLTGLAAGETPLPGVEYHTFGGTSVLFTRLIDRAYTPSSAVLVPGVGFTHVVTSVQNPLISPAFTAYPPVNASAETTPGLGDFLVSDASSRLPFEHSHRTNPLNHAEVLWSPVAQAQVLALLATDDTWEGWTTHPGSLASGGRVRLVRDGSDRLLLFAGPAHDLRWRGEEPGAVPPADSPGEAPGWSAWTDFGQQGFVAAETDLLQPPGGGPAASHLHVFGLGTPADAPDDALLDQFGPEQRNVWTRQRGPGGTWSSWTDLGGTVYGPNPLDSSRPAVRSTLRDGPAAVRNHRGAVELFATGHDGRLWTARQAPEGPPGPPGRFSAWSRLAIPSHGPVGAVRTLDGSILVLVRDAGLAPACYRRAPDSEAWQEWVLPAAPALAGFVATHDRDGRVVLLARGPQGRLWWTREKAPAATTATTGGLVRSRDRGLLAVLASAVRSLARLLGLESPVKAQGRWYPWSEEEGPFASGLAVERDANGALAVVALDGDGRAVYRAQGEPLGGWTPWQGLGGDLRGTPALGRLADGRLAVLGVSAEGRVRQRTQVTPGQW